MLEEYLIEIIKDMKVENICLESNEDKTHWYFSCYIGTAYDNRSHEVWIEGTNPFKVLEEALTYLDRYRRGCMVGSRKHAWRFGRSKKDTTAIAEFFAESVNRR